MSMNEIINKNSTATLAGFMNGRRWIGHADERHTFDGAVPRQAALDMLSFPVGEGVVKSTILTPDGVLEVEDPTRKSIVRLDTMDTFGIFKQGYKLHNYGEWLVDNVDLLLDGGLEIGTVALTKGGARALLQAELPDSRAAEAPGAEPVPHRPHITAATSMDGSIATTYGVGTRVLICENELSLAGYRSLVKDFSSFTKIRHSSNSLARIGQVRESLGLVVEEIGDAFDKQFRELVSQYVSDAKWDEVVRSYTGVDKAKEGRSKTMAQGKVDALNTLWREDERAAPWKNSAYGVLAAFNTAQHHVFGSDKGRTERNQDRIIQDEWQKFDGNVLSMLASV